jgi:hypothetical protein
MKSKQTIKQGAVWTAPVGLSGIASRILAGAVALLLISAAFGDRAWAITSGGPDNTNHPYVGAMIAVHPKYGVMPFTGILIHPRVILTAGHATVLAISGGPGLLGVSFDQNANVNDSSTWQPVSVSRVISAYTGRPPNTMSGYGSADTDIGIIILDKPVFVRHHTGDSTAAGLVGLAEGHSPTQDRSSRHGVHRGRLWLRLGLASAAAHPASLGPGYCHA